MGKCPKCNQVYDNTWKVCLHCSIGLVDETDVYQETTIILPMAAIDKIENIMANLSNPLTRMFKNTHDSINVLLNTCRLILNDINEEFLKEQVNAVHLTWFLNMTYMQIANIDAMIGMEIDHSDNHKNGFHIITPFVEHAHNVLGDAEKYEKALIAANNKKVKSLAPRVSDYIKECHKVLCQIEGLIKNAKNAGLEEVTDNCDISDVQYDS